MATTNAARDALKDGLEAVKLVAHSSWRRNVGAFVYVPVGLMMVLLVLFGVNAIIRLFSASFPASVACMILLFFCLTSCVMLVGGKKTRAVVKLIDIPCGFALRFISIFFTPAFVTMPLTWRIWGLELGKIVAIFTVGYLAMFIFTAYMVRGLQKIFRTSKRSMVERAEEVGNDNDEIPLAENVSSQQANTAIEDAESDEQFRPWDQVDSEELTAPPPAHHASIVRVSSGHPLRTLSSHGERPPPPIQDPIPINRPQKWAAFVNVNLDSLIYLVVFLFAGLPVYYATGYAMPAQLTLNVLAYFTALSMPVKYKRFLHPVLVCSVITVFLIWLLSLSHGQTLFDGLRAYSTGTKYLCLWDGEKGLRSPGAGDIFSSIFDVSIVALAMPMFNYRQELKRFYLAILIPLLPLTLLSISFYPILCHYLGLSPAHALSFPSRSLTLALALPVTANLGGTSSLTALMGIMSGVITALVGNYLLNFLRIPEDDYVTRGVTMGANGSAIATAMLLATDPRAASLSGLITGVWGAVMVGVTAVPAVASWIGKLAGQ